MRPTVESLEENSRSESCESPTWSKENDALAAENQKMKRVL